MLPTFRALALIFLYFRRFDAAMPLMLFAFSLFLMSFSDTILLISEPFLLDASRARHERQLYLFRFHYFLLPLIFSLIDVAIDIYAYFR